MFPCVWLHFKKFSGKYILVFGKEEGKHKSENTKPQPRKKNHQQSQHKIAITARSRSEITINGAIAIWIVMAPDCDLAVDRAVGLELELAISDWIFSSRARALSLSLFPEVN